MSAFENWHSLLLGVSQPPSQPRPESFSHSTSPRVEHHYSTASCSWTLQSVLTAVLLGATWTLLAWFWIQKEFRKHEQSIQEPKALSARLVEYDESIKLLARRLSQRIRDVEERVPTNLAQKNLDVERSLSALSQRLDPIEECGPAALRSRIRAIEGVLHKASSYPVEEDIARRVQVALCQRIEEIDVEVHVQDAVMQQSKAIEKRFEESLSHGMQKIERWGQHVFSKRVEDIEKHCQNTFDQRVAHFENWIRDSLRQQVVGIEGRAQDACNHHVNSVERNASEIFNQRTAAIEKSTQEGIKSGFCLIQKNTEELFNQRVADIEKSAQNSFESSIEGLQNDMQDLFVQRVEGIERSAQDAFNASIRRFQKIAQDAFSQRIESIERKGTGKNAQHNFNQHIEDITSYAQEAFDQRIEEIENRVEEAFSQRVEAIEANLRRALSPRIEALSDIVRMKMDKMVFHQRVDAIEANIRKTINPKIEAVADDVRMKVDKEAFSQVDTIEANLRKILVPRVEALTDMVRMKLDEETFDGKHKVVLDQISAIREGVRIVDSKQLDSEATHVMQRRINQRIEAVEDKLHAVHESVEDRLRTVNESVEDKLQSVHTGGEDVSAAKKMEAITDNVRVVHNRTKSLTRRIEAVEDKLQTVNDSVENGLRAVNDSVERKIETVDNSIDRKLGKVNDSVDEKLRTVNNSVEERMQTMHDTIKDNLKIQTASFEDVPSNERIEAIEDDVRGINNRTKLLTQRMDVIGNDVSSFSEQAILLSNNLSRGWNAIEILQMQVEHLPDSEKLNELSRECETKITKLEAETERYRNAVDEEQARKAEAIANLSWSNIDSQQIEPAGPVYSTPFHKLSTSFNGEMPPTPSPSVRSFSNSSMYTPSPVAMDPVTPVSSGPNPIDLKRFRENTFSWKQKTQRQLANKKSYTKLM